MTMRSIIYVSIFASSCSIIACGSEFFKPEPSKTSSESFESSIRETYHSSQATGNSTQQPAAPQTNLVILATQVLKNQPQETPQASAQTIQQR